jgi:pyruvate formate lyase activating enzyme
MYDGRDIPERKALIFNVQKYNMYDGPGVRTMIFFKGCPLRCQWCSNPEGMQCGHQVIFKHSNCVNCGACASVCPQGIHRMSATGEHFIDRSIDCIGCNACEGICSTSALSVAGVYKTISELVDVIMEDKAFYDYSGGGVTLGGGEVTLQPEAAINLLAACKRRRVNTAIETCGYTKTETILKFAEYTDMFLFDIKHIDPALHQKYTGVRNETILGNLKELLERKHAVKVRIPLLHGINDADETLSGICDFLAPWADAGNFKGIDILPYHKLGVNKYNQLDMDYSLSGNPVMSEEALKRVTCLVESRGLKISVIRH